MLLATSRFSPRCRLGDLRRGPATRCSCCGSGPALGHRCQTLRLTRRGQPEAAFGIGQAPVFSRRHSQLVHDMMYARRRRRYKG